jgi:hypothetical protein
MSKSVVPSSPKLMLPQPVSAKSFAFSSYDGLFGLRRGALPMSLNMDIRLAFVVRFGFEE